MTSWGNFLCLIEAKWVVLVDFYTNAFLIYEFMTGKHKEFTFFYLLR